MMPTWRRTLGGKPCRGSAEQVPSCSRPVDERATPVYKTCPTVPTFLFWPLLLMAKITGR